MTAWTGLGANPGEPQAAIVLALREIAALPGAARLRASSLYRSAPRTLDPDLLSCDELVLE